MTYGFLPGKCAVSPGMTCRFLGDRSESALGPPSAPPEPASQGGWHRVRVCAGHPPQPPPACSSRQLAPHVTPFPSGPQTPWRLCPGSSAGTWLAGWTAGAKHWSLRGAGSAPAPGTPAPGTPARRSSILSPGRDPKGLVTTVMTKAAVPCGPGRPPALDCQKGRGLARGGGSLSQQS